MNFHQHQFLNAFNLNENKKLIFGEPEQNTVFVPFAIYSDPVIIELNFHSFKSILTELGGFYTFLIHSVLFLVTPMLYISFNQSVVKEVNSV